MAASGKDKVGQPIGGAVRMVAAMRGPATKCLGKNVVVAASHSKEKEVHG